MEPQLATRGGRGRRAALAALGVLLGLALIAGLAIRGFQEHFVFFPTITGGAGPAHQVFWGHGEDITLETSDGLTLTAWLVRPRDAARDRHQAVLYAPGAGGTRADRETIARNLSARGFTVLMLDYRGYAGNPGRIRLDGAVLDAAAGQRALAERQFEPQRTIYVGESIGTVVVTRLAEQVPPAGLVLRSPFPDYLDVARIGIPAPRAVLGLVLNRLRYPVAERLAASQVPVTVIWGSQDTVIPPDLSAQVAERAGNLFEQFTLIGAGNNHVLWQGDVVVDAVERLADATMPAAG